MGGRCGGTRTFDDEVVRWVGVLMDGCVRERDRGIEGVCLYHVEEVLVEV